MKRHWVLLGVVVAGCGGGGGGGGTTNAQIGGAYGGFFTEQPQDDTFNLIAAIAPDGQAFAHSANGGRIYSGSLTTTGSSLSGSFR